MITNNNLEILQEINLYKNWNKNTYTNVKYAVTLYTEFNNETLSNLIKEAETEEEHGILMKKRTLKQRLLKFQSYLLNDKQFAPSSVKNIMTNVKTIYYFYELQIPKLPLIIIKDTENINDIPTKENIKDALTVSSPKMRALISFMASSGTARNEASHLTIHDFITATQEYHNKQSIQDVLTELEGRKDVIPTFALTRIKTGKTYYTFCSNESIQLIVKMLKERQKRKILLETDSLFELKPNTITVNFKRLNDKLEFGFKENRRFFHPHSLRKFFTSTLFGKGLDFVSIEFMLGHSIGKTQEAYFKANPERQKNKYSRYVGNLCFFENTEYITISDKEKRELEMLRRENIETKQRLRKLEEIIDILKL